MAIVITPILAGTDTYIADVAADGADTSSGNIAHGLGVAPLEVNICLRTADVATIASWAATTIDATNVVATRAAGGAAASTFRVTIKKPHSIGR